MARNSLLISSGLLLPSREIRESLTPFRLRKIQRRWFRRKRKAIAFLENGNVIENLFASVADFQEIGFQQGNSIRKKFRQRSMQIAAERRVQRILEDVCQFPGNFGESRKSITRRSAAQRVCRDVEALQIFSARL